MDKYDPGENFKWREDGGFKLAINANADHDIAPEVFYENDLLQLKDQSLYMGEALGPWRFYAALSIVLTIILALVGRAAWMQIVEQDKYLAAANNNRLRDNVLGSMRGVVTDRHGVVLVANRPTFDVLATPMDLPENENIKMDLLGQVSRITGVLVDSLQTSLDEYREDRGRRVVLVRDVGYEKAVALKIALGETRGLEIVSGQKRDYLYSAELPSLSHILGYVGKISPEEWLEAKSLGYLPSETIGKTGVEYSYEKYLRGTPGVQIVEVDALGKPQRVVKQTPPVDGEKLVLALDLGLQRATEKALKASLEKAKLTKGSAVVIDVNTGGILAAVSLPAYDNNIFTGQVSSTVYASLLDNPDHPFLSRVWAGQYPSGSTIKPVYAVAALAENVITARTTFLSTGGIRIGQQFFPDWKAGGHGVTDVRRAIAWSVNTFFYMIGGGHNGSQSLGIDRMDAWLKKFGFGSIYDTDIPGQSSGFVPDPAWKQTTQNDRWYIGDTYNLSIGQGALLVTPLQIAAATAAIANGGHKVTPHFNLDINGKYSPESATIADPFVIKTVQNGMRDTVVYGSGRALSSLSVTSAGKTGTAQWRSDKANHAWYTGYAPADNPKIAITVMLEEGEEGSLTAVPVVADILRAWYELEVSSQP